MPLPSLASLKKEMIMLQRVNTDQEKTLELEDKDILYKKGEEKFFKLLHEVNEKIKKKVDFNDVISFFYQKIMRFSLIEIESMLRVIKNSPVKTNLEFWWTATELLDQMMGILSHESIATHVMVDMELNATKRRLATLLNDTTPCLKV